MKVAENVLGYFSDAVLRDSSKNCIPEATSLENYSGACLVVSGARDGVIKYRKSD